ncbi:hypothetical protein Taro_044577 [Colocasia esculenta]|uniref:Uncharacterized protein n=1 Tax=Colocasia esculenta TaxID=4460 RepID=A0A843WP22_COLES|nr:hypothetical protein [Colocasia esculenta]
MLTNSAETAFRHHQTPAAAEPPSTQGLMPAKTDPKRRPAFKLYEHRHHSFKNLKAIGPLLMPRGSFSSLGGASVDRFSLRKPNILSPRMLDFPTLTLSIPLTPLILNLFSHLPYPNSATKVLNEECPITEKGFYHHASPKTTPSGMDPPRLLPLFPVATPRITTGSLSTANTP